MTSCSVTWSKQESSLVSHWRPHRYSLKGIFQEWKSKPHASTTNNGSSIVTAMGMHIHIWSVSLLLAANQVVAILLSTCKRKTPCQPLPSFFQILLPPGPAASHLEAWPAQTGRCQLKMEFHIPYYSACSCSAIATMCHLKLRNGDLMPMCEEFAAMVLFIQVIKPLKWWGHKSE